MQHTLVNTQRGPPLCIPHMSGRAGSPIYPRPNAGDRVTTLHYARHSIEPNILLLFGLRICPFVRLNQEGNKDRDERFFSSLFFFHCSDAEVPETAMCVTIQYSCAWVPNIPSSKTQCGDIISWLPGTPAYFSRYCVFTYSFQVDSRAQI